MLTSAPSNSTIWPLSLLGKLMTKMRIPVAAQSIIDHVIIVFVSTFVAQLVVRVVRVSISADEITAPSWAWAFTLISSAAAAGGSAVLHYLRGYIPASVMSLKARYRPARFPRLGKQPYRHDPRNLQLVKYFTSAVLPSAPAWKNWMTKIKLWPMFLNDREGDCTAAAIAHMEECWSANAGAEFTITDDEVQTVYVAVSGFDPATGANDNGALISDVLKYWQKTGIAGHKIAAYAQVDFTNLTLVRQAIDVFGGVDIGIQLPVAAQNMGNHWKLPAGQALTGDYEPGSWGGHSVCVLAYNDWSFLCVSWGQVIRIDVDFWLAYLDEAWAAISEDFFRGTRSASGFDMAQMQADLAVI